MLCLRRHFSIIFQPGLDERGQAETCVYNRIHNRLQRTVIEHRDMFFAGDAPDIGDARNAEVLIKKRPPGRSTRVNSCSGTDQSSM